MNLTEIKEIEKTCTTMLSQINGLFDVVSKNIKNIDVSKLSDSDKLKYAEILKNANFEKTINDVKNKVTEEQNNIK